ncbi:MAG TPA: RNA 2'-phosphotransferase [Protaetiibacter sp.]|nr:RNA 2'-phosphotransferase [Protaetiibacter sp.]
MDGRPSPAHFARLNALVQQPASPVEIGATLRTDFPSVIAAAEQYGLDTDESLSAWLAEFDPVGVRALVSASSSPFDVARWVRESLVRREAPLPLVAYLVIEERLRFDATRTSGYLRSAGTSLELTYIQLLERLAEAFLDAAFHTTWQRRVVFNRALDSARAYLSYIREQADLSGKPLRRGIQTRLGISTVLAARFGPVDEAALIEAKNMLLSAHREGAEHALGYFLEAAIWLYDLFDDVDSLRQAARLAPAGPSGSVATATSQAHIWLRLAGMAESASGRDGFLTAGRTAIASLAIGHRKEDIAGRTLLEAMYKSLEHQARAGITDLSTRGVLFPFGLRRPDTAMPASFERALPELIASLRDSDHSGDYLFRDLQAELHSSLARIPDIHPREATDALEAAITLREGRRPYEKPLNRPGIEIDLAEDRFALAAITGSSEVRRAGFRVLLGPASPPVESPRHLTIMAREVDLHGPLSGFLLEGPDDLAFAIRSGDSGALFEAAARAAYESADLAQIQLGGRSGAVSLRDSDGAAGQTFVFKRMTAAARERDHEFTERVRMEIIDRHLAGRFGLIEHLAEINGPSDGRDDEVISVRRYANGEILSEHLRTQPRNSTVATLSRAAEFLALVHWAGAGLRTADGCRREIKEKELGRWLRSIVPDAEERSQVFEWWWAEVATAPLLARRDAHPMNWLVDSQGRLLAVDLESTGVRPFGYELAQLVEDRQLLAPDDWEGRAEIIASYTSTWNDLSGSGIDAVTSERLYLAGAMARGVRTVSDPTATPSARAHGGRLLERIAGEDTRTPLGMASELLAQRWSQLTGNVGEEAFEVLSSAERRRISRAMAYRLRHDKSAPVTRDGWMHVDELAELLRKSGHKVTPQQLILIAGALGEPRFELDGYDIRAVYGHSTATSIEYPHKRPPKTLYHATPLSNLASIFEARAGLVSGKRNWVHLTESCLVALNAARRQQSSIAVLEVDAPMVDGLVYAAGSTWLAPVVKAEHLRFLPLREIRDLMSRDARSAYDG